MGPVAYEFNQPAGDPEPVPVQITEYASPLDFTARSWVNAFYGQDQWTMRRLTLNLGVRYDFERGYAPAQNEAAGYFTPAHSFPAVKNIPDWNDIEPRIGAAYNLFGNAKSAIKGAIGRYVVGDYSTTTVANTPADAIVTSATRTWTMTPGEIAASNGDYVPNCDLANVVANGECGALSNNGFGGVSTNTSYDPKYCPAGVSVHTIGRRISNFNNRSSLGWALRSATTGPGMEALPSQKIRLFQRPNTELTVSPARQIPGSPR